ncbi:MAG TPA: response regulator transcription factor [Chloroflexota bacterium]
MSTVEIATILLVDDDGHASTELINALSQKGQTVWHAETAADARAILRHAHPGLIILDLTLPDVDGLVFCTQLNTGAPDVPFMVCSTGTLAEKVLSFKLGAEDFVEKPYQLPELEARIEAILRRHADAERTPSAPQNVVNGTSNLGGLRVDLARWRVTLDDKPLDLTPTEFQLLVFMARRPGEIISRQELARGVWGNENMSSSRTVDAYVRRISSKLSSRVRKSHDEWPPRILNIRGLGYQLSVPRVSAA